MPQKPCRIRESSRFVSVKKTNIEATFWKSDISTPLACIEVEDQGIGIEEANLARVIEPFYTTKAFSARHGTGLGLSVVYEMAKEMDASLTVESTPGQGSSFRIFIALK